MSTSEAKISIGNTTYTIPVLPPASEVISYADLARDFYVKQGDTFVKPSDEIVADLMAASQSIWILSAGTDYSSTRGNSLFNDIDFTANLYARLEESYKDEVIVENLLNTAVSVVLYAAAIKLGVVTFGAGTVVSMGMLAAFDTYWEYDSSERKIAILEMGRDLLYQGHSALEKFMDSPLENIYSATEYNYNIEDLKEGISNAMTAHAAAQVAFEFAAYVAHQEGKTDWADTAFDTLSVIPGLNVSMKGATKTFKAIAHSGDVIDKLDTFFNHAFNRLSTETTVEDYERKLLDELYDYNPTYTNPFNEGQDFALTQQAARSFTLQGTDNADDLFINHTSEGQVVHGQGGDDMLAVGYAAGNDTLKGGAGNDTYGYYGGSWGQDLIDDDGGTIILSLISRNNFAGYDVSKIGSDLNIIRGDESIRVKNFFTFWEGKSKSELSGSDYRDWNIQLSDGVLSSADLVALIPSDQFSATGDNTGTPAEETFYGDKTITLTENEIGRVSPGESVDVKDLVSFSGGSVDDFDALYFIDRDDSPNSGYFEGFSQGETALILTPSGNDKIIQGFNSSVWGEPEFFYWDQLYEDSEEWEDAEYIGGTGSNDVRVIPLIIDPTGRPSNGSRDAEYKFYFDGELDFNIQSTVQPNQIPTVQFNSLSVKGDEAFGVSGTVTDGDGDSVNVGVTLTSSSTSDSSAKVLYQGTALTLGEMIAINADLLNRQDFSLVNARKGDSFSFSAYGNDGKSASIADTFTITVGNTAPIAIDDEISIPDSLSSISFTRLLTNDQDVDGDNLTITSVSGSPEVSLSNGAIFLQSVSAGQTLAFEYVISDGIESSTATARVHVGHAGDDDDQEDTVELVETSPDVIPTGARIALSDLFSVSGGEIDDFDGFLILDLNSDSDSGYFETNLDSVIALTLAGEAKVIQGLSSSNWGAPEYQFWNQLWQGAERWADSYYTAGTDTNSARIIPLSLPSSSLASEGPVAAQYEQHLQLALDLDLVSPVANANRADLVNGINIDDAGNSISSQEVITFEANGRANIVGTVGVDEDSDDYYQFTANGSGELSVLLTGLSGNAYTRLYDGDGTQLETTIANDSNDKTLTYAVSAGESYSVRVDPYGTAEAQYQLQITQPGPGTGAPDPVTPPSQPSNGDDTINGTSIGDAGNSWSDADTITFDANGQATMSGTVGVDADSDDYYRFTAAESGDVTIVLSGLTDNAYTRLYDANGTQLETTIANDSNDKTLTYAVSAGESYSVRVDPYGTAEAQYQLQIIQPAPGTGAPDPVTPPPQPSNGDDTVNGASIGDAGNSWSDADTITFDANGQATMSGTVGVDADSDDYYRFTAAESGDVTIVLSGLTDNAYTRLYDANGTQLETTIANDSNDKTLTYAVSAGESYSVRVDPYGTAEAQYQLQIIQPAPGTGAPDPVTPPSQPSNGDDTINGASIGDAGNSAGTAASVTLNTGGISLIEGSNGFGSDDNDYYRITIDEKGTLDIQLAGLSQDLDLILRSSTGAFLNSSMSAGTDSEYLSQSVEAGDVLFVQVAAFGSSESAYTLDLQATPEAGSQDAINGTVIGDAGDTFSDAELFSLAANTPALIAGSSGYGLDEIDFYRFTATASGEITLSLTGLTEDLDLALFSSDGTSLAESSNSLGGDESIAFSVAEGSSYLIEVDPFGTAQSVYQLSANLSPDTQQSQTDRVNGISIGDAGDSLSGSYPIQPDDQGNVTIQGFAGFGNDEKDIYKLVASTGGSLEIGLSGLNADLDLFLRDSSGSIIASSTAIGSNSEQISYTVQKDETYYIDIDVYSSNESAYSLNISAPSTSGTSSLSDILAFTSRPTSPLSLSEAEQLIDSEIGSNYRLATWSDIEALWDTRQSEMETFFENEGSTGIAFNGSTQYSSSRFYFLADHNGSKPSHFLAHEEVGGNEISLGSWYGPYQMLAISENYI